MEEKIKSIIDAGLGSLISGEYKDKTGYQLRLVSTVTKIINLIYPTLEAKEEIKDKNELTRVSTKTGTTKKGYKSSGF